MRAYDCRVIFEDLRAFIFWFTRPLKPHPSPLPVGEGDKETLFQRLVYSRSHHLLRDVL
jgi:hypothetical protein